MDENDIKNSNNNNESGTSPSPESKTAPPEVLEERQQMLKTDEEEQEVVSNLVPAIGSSNATGTSSSCTPEGKKLARNISIGCTALIVVCMISVIFGVQSQPRNRYPNCRLLDENEYGDEFLNKLGDGNCDRDPVYFKSLNSKECGYDAGDCNEFNKKYADCVPGIHPSGLSDFGGIGYIKTCQNKYNTEACGFDDGLCTQFNLDYPNCKVDGIEKIGDGDCSNTSHLNTKECGWEGGDCLHRKYPDCTGINPYLLYDTDFCTLELNTKECGFDNGACKSFNENYSNCNTVLYPDELNNKKCFNHKDYNNERCDFDGGDCVEFNKNASYTECDALRVSKLADGKCDGVLTDDPTGYNSEQCAFDGGDCVEFNSNYPNCPFYFVEKNLGGKSTL
jgi:hypothetical protein